MELTPEVLRELGKDLPIIRPIKEFIHLNLLMPYQDRPFWEALRRVSENLEANPFRPLGFYRSELECGRIPEATLRSKLVALLGGDADAALAWIKEGEFAFVHHDSRLGPLHLEWQKALESPFIEVADGLLIKWLSMFLDQGLGHVAMPGAGSQGFYDCVRSILAGSLVTPVPFRRRALAHYFPATPEAAIAAHLPFLCPPHELRLAYARESLTTLRGWAGLVATLEQNPRLLPFARSITLVDFLAVKFTLERAWIETEDPDAVAPSLRLATAALPQLDDLKFQALRACQETLEEATYAEFLRQFQAKPSSAARRPRIQALFCMDDREGPLREFLEALDPELETFGTAGHFGVDCLYQHPEDAFPKKHCPAPVTPRFLLREQRRGSSRAPGDEHALAFDDLQPSGSFLYDWMLAHVRSLVATAKLARNIFSPLKGKDLSSIREPATESELHLLRDHTSVGTKLPEGLTVSEMATLVAQQLKLIGVTQFGELFVVVGHGSVTTNNPYFATYGCGACSGRSGGVNARAFVEMFNRSDVRALMAQEFQLAIPATSVALAAHHDTTQDVVTVFDAAMIPASHRATYEAFKRSLSKALAQNAERRVGEFRSNRPEAGLRETIRRAHSLFETRPELGHTNVAFAVVGKRSSSAGLRPSCPAFLQSYDAATDPDASKLAVLLGAVIPVCSGINLDYFFSRMDNLRFGAGSKLPQNIVGHIGVSHGTESDLLVGLPFQMIDQHVPLRLVVLVEQTPTLALAAIQHNLLVRQIVENQWIHYLCFDRTSQQYSVFRDGAMVPLEATWN